MPNKKRRGTSKQKANHATVMVPLPAAFVYPPGVYLPDEVKDYLVTRLKRLRGHIDRVIAMIEDEMDCESILTQLAAVRAGLTGVTGRLVEHHIEVCVHQCGVQGKTELMTQRLKQALKYLIRAY